MDNQHRSFPHPLMRLPRAGDREIRQKDIRALPISRERMLMYGKEASNRKQEIDRQHYTIPNQRPKDKHCGKI